MPKSKNNRKSKRQNNRIKNSKKNTMSSAMNALRYVISKNINLKFKAECNTEFLKKCYNDFNETIGTSNVAFLVYLTKWYRETLEKQMDEQGIKNGTAYAIAIGDGEAVSGIGSIIYIEAIKGIDGYITVEYDGPTFAQIGLTNNDVLMATMHFYTQSTCA